MSVNSNVLADLGQKTPDEEIKQRPTFRKVNGRRVRGPDLSYVDARYVMDTLDKVVGPESWKTEYKAHADGSVECTVYISLVNGEGAAEWVGKTDVGVPSTIEPRKGAYSDAFKRAAVHWGIARDLYEDRAAEMQEPPPDDRPIRERTTDAEDEDDEPLPFRDRSSKTSSRGSTRGSSRSGGRGGSSGSRGQQHESEYERFMEGWEVEDSPWYCPEHDQVKVVPNGVNRSGKAYGAFLACTERNCDEKGPWISDLLKGD